MRNDRMGIVPGLAMALGLAAVATAGEEGPKVGRELERRGDEIVACGRLFHATTPVVLWTDPGGYDAYRVERRFAPMGEAGWAETQKEGRLRSPNRFALRRGLAPEQAERVRGGGWDLPQLQEVVDQFVIHFDARGTSRRCFEVLHDLRGLSVQFMLDLDGTIYQTLDLKEGAWHATIANSRSIGIEVANIGAYPVGESDPLGRWYEKDADGHTRITIPGSPGRESLRHPDLPLRPARDEPIVGNVQGKELRQYDFTPQQYDALIRLTATLCAIFPKVRCDYPREPSGAVVPHKLPDDELKRYRGILGHYHVQTNKVDPGPAFQWDRVIDGARKLLAE